MLEQGDHFVAGQSDPLFVPSVMQTHLPLTDDPAQPEEDLLQRYKERIEKLSQQDRVSKFCADAGFLTTVEVGQYFMTKDTEEFTQFTDSVACREYILPRDENLSEPKGWIRGNTKIGPALEVTTCCLQGKNEVEIRIESLNKDHSHLWVRISHGLNKLVTNKNDNEQDDNEQETSEMQFEDYALKSNARAFASRSKAKAKPQKRDSVSSSTRTIHIGERTWADIEPQEYSLTDYSVSKKLNTLLRHGSLPQEDDGAIEFWRIKDYLQNHFVHSRHWSDEKWKSTMARGGGNKNIFQYCTDSSGEILYLRALQGHSGRNLIDPSLQDNVVIPNDFFEYIYHVGCAINLHSIINSGLIPGGQNLSKIQSVFFLRVNPIDKEHKDPEHDRLGSTTSCTVHAYSVEETSKHGVLGRHQTCSKERTKVLSNAIERHHPLQYTPRLLYPASCLDGKWSKSYTKKFMNHLDRLRRFSLSNDWMKELDSEVARQAEDNQPTQPNPNPIYRTERPVVTEQTSRSSAQEIDARFSLDCKNTILFVERLEKDKDTDKDVDADRDRTGRPVVSGQPTGLFTQLEEVDIDFRGVWIATCSCETSRKFSCS